MLRALEETENALVTYREEQQRLVKLADQARESSRAAAIARVRYREGVADFLALLDAERTELQAEDAVAQAEAGVFTSVVAVYKALGGIPFAEEPSYGTYDLGGSVLRCWVGSLRCNRRDHAPAFFGQENGVITSPRHRWRDLRSCGERPGAASAYRAYPSFYSGGRDAKDPCARRQEDLTMSMFFFEARSAHSRGIRGGARAASDHNRGRQVLGLDRATCERLLSELQLIGFDQGPD